MTTKGARLAEASLMMTLVTQAPQINRRVAILYNPEMTSLLMSSHDIAVSTACAHGGVLPRARL